jgi:hypothetical protein
MCLIRRVNAILTHTSINWRVTIPLCASPLLGSNRRRHGTPTRSGPCRVPGPKIESGGADARGLANMQRTFEGMTVPYARVDLAQCVAAVREQAERVKEVRHDQLSDAATIHVS